MIINVKQTYSKFKEKFEIKIDNELKYLALIKKRKYEKIRFTDIENNDCFFVKYDEKENLKNIFGLNNNKITGEKSLTTLNLFDSDGNRCGNIFEKRCNPSYFYYILNYNNYSLYAYNVGLGKTEHIVIYNNDIQIAEIVKPLIVRNNLDIYDIFLLDKYSELSGILSYFTIIYDFINNPNGEYFTINKIDSSLMYTKGLNKTKYNYNWLYDNFDNNILKSYEKKLEIDYDTKNTINKNFKFIKITFIIAGIFAIIFTIFALSFAGYL